MRVEVVKPEELGAPERRTWWDWQQSDVRLANPFLSASFARLAGRVNPAARVGVLSDPGGVTGFWSFRLDRLSIAGPVVRNFTGLQGVVHGPGLSWDWPTVLARAGLVGMHFDHLAGHQADGLPGAVRVEESPSADLTGGWEGYERWITERHRRFAMQNRGKWKKACGRHEVAFLPDDRSPDALEALFRQKSAQCRRNGWVDVFSRSWARDFVSSVASASEADLRGLVSTLRFDGTVVAVCVALEAFGTRCNWMLAYDPTYSWYRPGIQLTLQCIRHAAEAGCRTLSLGKGAERYKRTLCQGTDRVAMGTVGAAGPAGQVFRAATWPLRAGTAALGRSPELETAARGRVRNLRRFWYARTAT